MLNICVLNGLWIILTENLQKKKKEKKTHKKENQKHRAHS